MGGCFTNSKNQVIHPVKIPQLESNKVSFEESKATMEGNPTTQTYPTEYKRQNNYVPLKKKKVRETVKSIKHTEEQGVKMINDYAILDYLGQGAFAKVRLAIKKIGDQEKKFALKIFKKSQLKRKREYIRLDNGQTKIKDALEDVKREIAIMKKLDHPNIIALHEIIENPDKDKIIMVIDYANEGQLIEWDEEEQKFYYVHTPTDVPYPDSFLRHLFRDCVKGLYYLHRNQIIHRDLKPQNILMNDGNGMIADFGVSIIVGEDQLLGTTQGTYQFLSPEACDIEQVKEGIDGFSADIWALGVTFYCFVYMELPFNADSLSELIEVITKAELHFPSNNNISNDLKQFLKKLLTKDSKTRPKIQEVANDYWLNQGYQNLLEEIQAFQSELKNVSQEDINNAYSFSTYVRIINWVQHWKSSIHRKKNSHSNSDETSKQFNTQTKIQSKNDIIFQQAPIQSSIK